MVALDTISMLNNLSYNLVNVRITLPLKLFALHNLKMEVSLPHSGI
jgi:hypothetical protein